MDGRRRTNLGQNRNRDHAASMANGTFPQRTTREPFISITIVLWCRGLGRTLIWRSHTEKLTAMLQLLLAVAIAQKSVVANAMESPGQDVKQESPDELVGRES